MSKYAMYGYGIVMSLLLMTCAVLVNMDIEEPKTVTKNSIVYLPCIEEDIDVTKELTPFEKEFLFKRNTLGPGMIFEWEGKLYTTDYR